MPSSTGRSSLQKAAAEISGTAGSTSAAAASRRGSGRKTVTSFEVGSGSPYSLTSQSSAQTQHTVAKISNPRPRSENLGTSASYTVGGEAAIATKIIPSNNAVTRSENLGASASYKIGGDVRLPAPTTDAHKISSSIPKGTKKTKHFTIISPHDDSSSSNNSQQAAEFSATAMDIEHRSSRMDDLESDMHIDAKPRHPSHRSVTKTQTFCHIGGMEEEKKTIDIDLYDDDDDYRDIEQMEGVIDQGTKMPLVVLDGANVAYAYAKAMEGTKENSSYDQKKLEPDARGIQIATDFFVEADIRALVVLPQYWFREGRLSHSANTLTSQAEILSDLKAKGLVVASPPTDDDDAYALTIAQREEKRSLRAPRNGEGPGFVLSNDMFRDAQGRDPSLKLKEWLNDGRNESVGPGRISYTFGDMGNMNDRGERVLDFVPNPRHPLIVWMDTKDHADYCS